MIPSERESSVDSTADISAEANEDVSAEVQSVRRALKEEQQRNLRLLADFENFRRRVAREQEAARHEGQRAALLPVLPVLDSLERALAAGSTDPEFYEGVAATHRLFVSALREAGVEPIESVGRPFDPSIHEAVATVSSDGVQPGTITREVRRGWQLGGSVLRPAQVVVAATREPDDPWR
ncbi:MAG TPA: nucleotide exchange factor GrpE [Candidatus Sulfotelmatobacter sp.]|nr:nucleotide exchange factor GrpE [Candidatus Sulfotelmatobacter sp.]